MYGTYNMCIHISISAYIIYMYMLIIFKKTHEAIPVYTNYDANP